MNKDIAFTILSKTKCMFWFKLALVCKDWAAIIKKLSQTIFDRIKFTQFTPARTDIKYFKFSGYDLVGSTNPSDIKVELKYSGIFKNDTKPYILLDLDKYDMLIEFNNNTTIPEYILQQIGQTFKHSPYYLYDYNYSGLKDALLNPENNAFVYIHQKNKLTFMGTMLGFYNKKRHGVTGDILEMYCHTIKPLVYLLKNGMIKY